MVVDHESVVVQFNASELGAELAQSLKIPLLVADLVRFADTECDVFLTAPFQSVEHKSVYLVAQFGGNFAAWSVNDFLMSLCFLASRIRSAGAVSITCVLPYYPYARQDILSAHGGISSMSSLTSLFEASGIDSIITFDLHNPRGLGNSSMLIRNISCNDFWVDVLRNFMKEFAHFDYVLVAPDSGAAQRVQLVAQKLGIEACFIVKRRLEVNQAAAISLSGNASGRYALILDDIIDTGRTAVSAAQFLLDHNVVGVSGFFTHAVLSATSLAVMHGAPFNKVVLANTLHPSVLGYDMMQYTSIIPFITKSVVKVISSFSSQSSSHQELYEPHV